MAQAPRGAIRDVRIMDDRGSFSAPTRVSWDHRGFRIGGDVAPGDLDGAGCWLIPGLVDAHVHAAWHDFDAADRGRRTPEETARLTADGLERLARSGFTAIRDAGGLTPADVEALPAGPRPALALSHRLIDRAAADAAGGLDAAVEAVLDAGADWVKLVGTAGVAAPAGATLEPAFSAAEVADAVERAERAGAGVLVHAWGGAAIDDAIEAGARSIEHAMYLTPEQARRAAGRGTILVPTVRIYRLVLAMIDAGELPAAFRDRVADAVARHPGAVRIARDAGVRIAVGTDSGTPEQHATGRLEMAALVDAGLSPEEALVAATRTGAELLAGTRAEPAAPVGAIADGARPDAVLLHRDPRSAAALRDPDLIAATVLDGRLLPAPDPAPDAHRDPHPTPTPRKDTP